MIVTSPVIGDTSKGLVRKHVADTEEEAGAAVTRELKQGYDVRAFFDTISGAYLVHVYAFSEEVK